MYHEAVQLLYSANRFRFPDTGSSTRPAVEYALIAPFFTMVGSRAALIKHICINFPMMRYVEPRHGLHEAHIKNLELIRDACASIGTLELSLDVRTRKVDDSPTAAEILQDLARRFEGIASLKDIVVNVDVYSDVGVSDTAVKWMRGYGWTVNMSQKEIYRGIQFDEYADRMYQLRRTSTPLSTQLALLRQIDRICIPAIVQEETPENVMPSG